MSACVCVRACVCVCVCVCIFLCTPQAVAVSCTASTPISVGQSKGKCIHFLLLRHCLEAAVTLCLSHDSNASCSVHAPCFNIESQFHPETWRVNYQQLGLIFTVVTTIVTRPDLACASQCRLVSTLIRALRLVLELLSCVTIPLFSPLSRVPLYRPTASKPPDGLVPPTGPPLIPRDPRPPSID